MEGLQVALVKKVPGFVARRVCRSGSCQAEKDHTHGAMHIEGLQADLERANQAVNEIKVAASNSRPKISDIDGLEVALGQKVRSILVGAI